jgi:hypothetical protein
MFQSLLSSTSNHAKIPGDRRQFRFRFPAYSRQRFTLLTEFSKWGILDLPCFEKCCCINAFLGFYLTYEELKLADKYIHQSAGRVFILPMRN